MQKKKQINPPINPGISLLLVVFLVLCLFTFSAITLTSAINEYKRSETLAINTKAYYTAGNKVEHELSEIVSRIKEDPATFTIEKTMEFNYDINDSQALLVTIEPLSFPESGKYFNITRWQVVSTTKWETNETMNLYIP